MDLGLENAATLVTGGASNIGRAIVHGLASDGARVAIADRDVEQAERVAEEARERGAADVLVLEADLTDAQAASAVVDAAAERWGGVDVLVNNAGWARPGFFLEDDADLRGQTLDVNLAAVMHVTQAALRHMRDARRGALVFIASDAAFGEPRMAVYGAAKAGVIGLARAVAREHGRDGIRSNVVCPGVVLPEGPDAIGSRSLWNQGADTILSERSLAKIRAAAPLGRLPQAEDVAAAVRFFASERTARQLTGQVVSVSAGYRMP